ncbi:oxysterol-binding protein-related protein 9 [Caerostris darwini]|uniref:Oxysterol-binding protein n=1 Tax=Caerostris darwini TaxID=1538125 RepID=A0AAV4PJG3_9ARAC|nr:oxysterol-binding protein-related protein 9 [Caerostris darwini]
MEGPLSKWTNVMKGWQYRWFVLDDNAGLLSYYTSKEKMVRGARRGCVRLKGAIIGIDDEDDSTFTITVDDKTFHFQARDTEERDKWIHALEDTILRHTQSYSLQTKWNEVCISSSLHDFDKKLTEADAYLQMLIDQITSLDITINNCTSDADRCLLSSIRDNANGVLEAVKHSIVLLQIAKNTTHPVNGVYTSYNLPKNSGAITHSNTTGKISGKGHIKAMECNSNINVDSAIECREDINMEKDLPTNLNLIVPETSYSSSDDDDDDFFDANDDAVISMQNTNVETVNADESTVARRHSSSQRLTTQDYDALYEDEEEELGSLEGQGSVISHLLSQVKIGMDLTKVVLPTFILERRSLLEMYADFFAHPDIFISIPDFDNPKDRFVQVIRWYLSAFHAGRKSSVAKKPYNPILGETFRCFWHIPNVKEEDDTPKKVTDGPVPWATRDHLTFIAEQVSHHPPISAFYAEHVNKGISCSAHIWTKSKFLGLSIGVQNIGEAIINVLKHNEEYVLTFPSGFGRSILGTPWIELGGAVTVTCAKTKYYANIEFITRPIYGGKKHRINAQLFYDEEKKPFLTVTGEWNGIMETKGANGETEVFVDTRTIPIIKKRVKPLVEQEEYESRKLWKDVTTALRIRNVEAATEAKYMLEQKQRQEAKQRLEDKTKWETRAFHLNNEHWYYDKSLQVRLQDKENIEQSGLDNST